MARNIIFVTLFLLLYGGLFLLGNHKEADLTDRNGYGVFDGTKYESERFSIKLDFDDDWLVFDGVSIENTFLSQMTSAEIEESYGAPMSDIAFIVGGAIPDATVYCVSLLDITLTDSDLNETTMRSTIDHMKKAIEGQGGTVGSASCRRISAKGNGAPMLLYYYDYEIAGTSESVFACLTNSGGNAIMLGGVYNSYNGLKALTELAENGLWVTAQAETAV